MRNYTTTEDVVVVGKRQRKKPMPKFKRWTRRIPLDDTRRVMVDVWITKPTPSRPYPTIFLAIGFAKSYALIPFRTPAQLNDFLGAFYKFMDQDVFASESPSKPGILEAWDDALEEARSIVAQYFDEKVLESLVRESLQASIDSDDSTTDDSSTPQSLSDGQEDPGEG